MHRIYSFILAALPVLTVGCAIHPVPTLQLAAAQAAIDRAGSSTSGGPGQAELESAREKIEKAGGTITLRQRPSLTSGKRSESGEAKKEQAPVAAAPAAKAKPKKPAAKKKKTAE